ncbi:porin family protein [Bacteriovoracaceae bacterium]|nr:porin family protein [Bacteriovoracaceae bacterium]
MNKIIFFFMVVSAKSILAFDLGASIELGSPLLYSLDQSQIMELDFRAFAKFEHLKIGIQVEQVQWDRSLGYDRIDDNIAEANDEPTGIENKTFLTGVYFTYDFLRFESFLFYFGGNTGQAARRFTYIDSTNDEEVSESYGEYYGAQVGGTFPINEHVDLSIEYLYHFISDDVEEFLEEDNGNYEIEMDNTLDLHMARVLLTVHF